MTEELTTPEPAPRQPARIYVQLFVVSIVMLALELLLIRWISTEIRIFAYFKNLVLIACFLGMSVGCLLAGRRKLQLTWTYIATAVLVATVVVPGHIDIAVYNEISALAGDFNSMLTWSVGEKVKSVPARLGALASVLVLFALIAGVFVPIGIMLGRLLDACPHKIAAYSANITGSLAGIWLYLAIAALALPPVVWFGSVLTLGLWLMTTRRERALGVAWTVVALALILTAPAPEGRTVWSPYQKLTYKPLLLKDRNGAEVPAGHLLTVNRIFYQRTLNMDPAYLRAHPALFPEAAYLPYVGYNFSYRVAPKPERMLIVGAGTGNDVAAALRNGAGQVDAVEIDASIVALGRQLHPERPYDDPRVNVIVDDARSVLRRAPRGAYDMVVFGALDSHTLSSSLSNIRIDNYVYTVEAFQEARSLLKEDGLLVLTFAAERRFLGERLYGMLVKAFGHKPIVFINSEVRALGAAGGGLMFLIDRAGQVHERLARDPRAKVLIDRSQVELTGDLPLSTDDWPYLYLESRAIPALFWIVMGMVVLLTGIVVKPVIGGLRSIDPHFFFLGGGFLLVEVQGISRLALVFGTTWVVNAVVITWVLIMILLGNVLAAKLEMRKHKLNPIYALLGISLLLNYAFPFGSLLALPAFAQGLIAGVIVSLPLFFASLVFITTFAGTAASHTALGSNLFGAIVGGMLESASFVAGINALGLLALCLYAGSWLSLRRQIEM